MLRVFLAKGFRLGQLLRWLIPVRFSEYFDGLSLLVGHVYPVGVLGSILGVSQYSFSGVDVIILVLHRNLFSHVGMEGSAPLSCPTPCSLHQLGLVGFPRLQRILSVFH